MNTKIILFSCLFLVSLLLNGAEDIADCMMQEASIEKSSGDTLAEKALAYLSQNGRFKPNEYDPKVCFDNYAYWLGLRNFNIGYFRRSVFSFTFAKGDHVESNYKYYKLAEANAAVGLAMTGQTGYVNALKFFDRIIDELPLEANMGRSVCLLMNNDINGADETMERIFEKLQLLNSKKVLIFCSIATGNEKVFRNLLSSLSDEQIHGCPFLANNVVQGLKIFSNNKNEHTDIYKTRLPKLQQIFDKNKERFFSERRHPTIMRYFIKMKHCNASELVAETQPMLALDLTALCWGNILDHNYSVK